jgi:hypothetical protein
MTPQERLRDGSVATADFAQHPAGCFVNQILLIV